jgi:hypothetical protein
MEISDIRRRVNETIDRAKRTAAERRARADEASREYEVFLEQMAVPIFRQVANVLKVLSYAFTVFTPGGSVRLMSDKNAQDFVEISLDSSGDQPVVLGHACRTRGRRVLEVERPIGTGRVQELTEEDVLAFVLKELEPLVER